MIQGPEGGLGEGGIAAVYPPGQWPPGQGLDPAFLAVQLRKLQKKQKGALRELQAASGREAFWKHSAQSAEQALDEVSPWLFGNVSKTCVSHDGRFCRLLWYCIQQELCSSLTLLSRPNMRFSTSEWLLAKKQPCIAINASSDAESSHRKTRSGWNIRGKTDSVCTAKSGLPDLGNVLQ